MRILPKDPLVESVFIKGQVSQSSLLTVQESLECDQQSSSNQGTSISNGNRRSHQPQQTEPGATYLIPTQPTLS